MVHGLHASASEYWQRPDLNLQHMLLNHEIVATDDAEVREMRLASGLGVQVQGAPFTLDLGYNLRGKLTAPTSAQGGTSGREQVSQELGARFSSADLNQLLGVDLTLAASSVFVADGVAQHRLAPGLSRSLGPLGTLTASFEHLQSQSLDQSLKQATRGYSLALAGSSATGRIAWSGRFRSSREYRAESDPVRSLDAAEVRSQVQLEGGQRLELSGSVNQEVTVAASYTAPRLRRHYRAAVAWAPSPEYTLGIQWQAQQDGERKTAKAGGRATLSWRPDPQLDLNLAYGPASLDGADGWLLQGRYRFEP